MPLKPTREENIVRLQNFFNSAEGDFALKQIDILCGYKADIFNSDPYIHAFNAGRRSAAVEIHDMLKCPVNKETKK